MKKKLKCFAFETIFLRFMEFLQLFGAPLIWVSFIQWTPIGFDLWIPLGWFHFDPSHSMYFTWLVSFSWIYLVDLTQWISLSGFHLVDRTQWILLNWSHQVDFTWLVSLGRFNWVSLTWLPQVRNQVRRTRWSGWLNHVGLTQVWNQCLWKWWS